jgi:hypothetical protein
VSMRSRYIIDLGSFEYWDGIIFSLLLLLLFSSNGIDVWFNAHNFFSK